MQEIQLLKAIEQDARISVTDLADILNSTPQQVDGEMKKLAEEKVICGITPSSTGIRRIRITLWR